MIGDRHGDRLRMDRRQLRRRVALRAVVCRGRLMVTDLPAARRAEREPCVRSRGDVTGEAGELLMAIVGEGIIRSQESGAWSWSCAWWVCIALPLLFRIEIDHRHPAKRAGGIERLRG